MRTIGILWVIACAGVAAGGSVASSTEDVYQTDVEFVPKTAIDRAVLKQLKAVGAKPARLCPDGIFLRRVYLDVIGTLPTLAEVEKFLASKDPQRRVKLIDRLLARKEFASYWAMKWADLLRVKAEFPINLWPNATAAYQRYVYTAIRDNKPYDQFARELLTSNGSNFRVAPVNFYRALQGKTPADLAKMTALTMLGQRAEHWPKAKREGFEQFFKYITFKPTREWKEEIVYFDALRAMKDHSAGGMPVASYPDGKRVQLTPDVDPRVLLADWMMNPKNDQFNNAIVNRVWAWLMGRGIIEPVDDIRGVHPASNPELLATLRKILIDNKYDLKKLYRAILTSQVYQLSCIPQGNAKEAARLFGVYSVRRFEAEVLVDALCQLTGTTEEYRSMIPEPFTFVPKMHRTIELPDGSITSPFLEMFGRPTRDTGMVDERNDKISAEQRLHMLNSSHVRNKFDRSPKIKRFMRDRRHRNKKIQRIYLMLLSRPPTAEELKKFQAYAKVNRRTAERDILWALINTVEFQYRH